MSRYFTSLLLVLAACSGEPATVEAPEAPKAPSTEEAKEAPAASAEHFTTATGEITVISRKNGEVEDTHDLKITGGDVTIPAGGDFLAATGHVDVDVSTWSSGVELRDERVKELFFTMADTPKATFTLSEVTGFEGKMVSSDVEDAMLEGKLTIGGVEGDAVFPVQVSRPTDDSWVVSTPNPVLLDMEDHGLADRVQAVADACGVELETEFKMSLTLHLGDVPAAEDETEADAPEAGGAQPAATTGGAEGAGSVRDASTRRTRGEEPESATKRTRGEAPASSTQRTRGEEPASPTQRSRGDVKEESTKRTRGE